MKRQLIYLILMISLIVPWTASAQDLSILGTIPVEKEMDSVALSPNTGIAYGISSEEKTLYIFDLKNYSIKKTVKLDSKPRAIAVNTSDNTAYITASSSSNLSHSTVIPFNPPLEKGGRGDLKGGQSGVSLTKGGDTTRDGNGDDKGGNNNQGGKDDKNTKDDKDGGDNKGDGGNKDGDNGDTGDSDTNDNDNENKGILYKVDSDGNILKTVEISKDPQGLAIDSSRNQVVIAIEKDKQLLILALDTFNSINSITLSHRPRLISLDIDSNRAVVVAGKAEGEGKQNQILIVDLNTGSVSYTIELKSEIKSLAVDTEKDLAVAVSKDEINVIDINTGEFPLSKGGEGVVAVDINQSTHIAVITGEENVMLLDLSSLTATRYTLNAEESEAIAVDKYKNTALLAAEGTSENNDVIASEETPRLSLRAEGEAISNKKILRSAQNDKGDSVIEVQLPNPIPSITNLIPKSARAGESGFSLKVEGDKFITSSSVQFNENDVSTTFKDNKELEASILSDLITSPGTVPVTVTNPPPDGGTSDPYSFTIKYPSPVLSSLSPNTISARSADFTLKTYGSNFMNGYVINFNGQNLSTSYINSGELNGIVPSSAIQTQGTYMVVVTTPDGQNSNYLSFTVTDPYPSITDFTPKEGQSGTVVTITGNNLNNTPTKVYFNGTQAVIQSITENSITTSVPSGATTGPIKIETSVGSVTSSTNFTVLSRQDFALSVSPQTVSIPYNGKASTVISIQSTGTEQFTGLVNLSVSVNSDSVTTNFNPEYISVNQSSILTLTSALTFASTLTISGTATIGGTDVTRTASLTIEPIAQGTTTVTGQVVASKDAKPIKGVTLKIGDLTTVTDDAGYFHFIDPPAGDQILMINGETANTSEATYASSIPMPVTIIGGQDNKLPYFIYLHQVNTKTFTPIDSTKDMIVTDPDVPDFEMRIPAGVQIIGWDGLPNEKVSLQIVARDRLPIPPPPDNLLVQTIYMFYFGKPGGGTPTQPIPVKLPNTLGSEPGTKFDMYYYDEEANPNPNSHQWKKFGTGTVSDNGRQVITDDGYGIPKFCCGAMFLTIRETNIPTPNPNPDCGCHCSAGKPVDLTTGVNYYDKKDITLNGRMPVELTRTYRTMEYTRGSPFGIGTSHNYDTMLTLSSTKQRMAYILPDGGKYYFYIQDDGSFKNTNSEKMYGATAYLYSDNSRSLIFKDGTIHSFDSSGRLIEIEDRNGNKITITRQAGGQITSIKEPVGRELTFSYDSSGRITTITDPIGRTVSYTYNPQGLLWMVTDSNGGVTTYTYDSGYRLLTATNPRDMVEETNVYDEYGRVSEQTYPDGGKYTFKYYTSSTPVRVTQPMYPSRISNCFPVFVREGESAPGMSCGTVYVNVPSSKAVPEDSTATNSVNQTIITNPGNSFTTYRFDGQQYILSITDGLGGEISYERETGTQLLKSVIDKLGRKTTYTHDSNGNIATVTDPDGNATSYEYDLTYNKPTKITDAIGNVTTMSYDDKGNLIQLTTPDSRFTSISYNSYGQPVSVTDALNNTYTFEYDSYGNLTKTTDFLGNSAKMEYDYVSRLISYTDPKNNVTQYAYDNLNRITEITDDLDGKTKFTYDANGNLLTVTDAKNQTISYTYNNRDKVATMKDQLGNTESYSYNKNDNLTSITNRKGQKTEYTYDYLDRKTKASYSDASYTNYTYDAISRLTYVDDSKSGAIEYSYSNTGCSSGCSGGFADKVIKEITSQGTINYTYDAIGQRSSMTVSGQPTVNYSYDSNSRLTNISTNFESSILNFGVSYDAVGRRTGLSLPNGMTTTYNYDSVSNLLSMEHLNPLKAILEKIIYTYDKNGNRESRNRQNVSVKLPSTLSATYNTANQMTTFNGYPLTYDNNGNLLTLTRSCGITSYTWNARNQLIAIDGYDDKCQSLTASFKYDALGRRIEKTVNGKTIQYLYDGVDIVQEIENGTVTVNYIRTLNIDEPLALINQDGVYYYIYDGLGSVIGLTDSSGQEVVQYYYDPFGNTSTNNSSFKNPFQYTGRENDNTGLYTYRPRYYSPELHRFISEDPIGFDGGDVNFYSYVWNNPVNYIDPFGLQAMPLPAPLPIPIPMPPNSSCQLTPEQWEGMKDFFNLFNPVTAYENVNIYFAKGKGDKYGPLWKAPGMPGWKQPTGDFFKDGPEDFWKKPSNWDKMSKWQKFKWWIGKIGGAIASGM